MAEPLDFTIRTPREVVFAGPVASARVPTETGLVGLRPRGEPVVLAVEPGLVLLRLAAGLHFAATAGGLLESGRRSGTLFTPFAAVGTSGDEMLAALEHMLETPPSELVARRQLGDLEQRILGELKQRPGDAAMRRGRRHD